MASSGHLRCCSDADSCYESLSRAKDASSIPWPRVIRYDARVELAIIPRWPHQVTYDVVATPIRVM
eukprot:scaffold14312_cov165-Skeletonema_marinoi.AAC.1